MAQSMAWLFRTLLFTLSVVLCVSPALSSEERNAAWFQENTGSGDWFGLRSNLYDVGVDLLLLSVTDWAVNPIGGRDQDAAYGGIQYNQLTVDMDKLAGFDDLSFVVSGSYSFGNDLTVTSIDNQFNVMEAFNGNSIRLNLLYLEQGFFDGGFSAAVGRLSPGFDFATAQSFNFYGNGAVNYNILNILVNVPSFASAPFAEWGTIAKIKPAENYFFNVAAYNADPEVLQDGRSGIDFRLNPEDGVLYVGEAGYNSFDVDKSTPSYAGRYSFGVYYDSSDYERLDDPDRTVSGNSGVWGIVEQSVYREAERDDGQGLNLWAAFSVGFDQSINSFPFGGYVGTYYKGLFGNRPDDITSAAVYYGEFSRFIEDQSFEAVVEVNHRIAVAPWAFVMPNLQYIVNPGGGGLPNAVVTMLDVNLSF